MKSTKLRETVRRRPTEFHSRSVKMRTATAVAKTPITIHTNVTRSSLLSIGGPASVSNRDSESRPNATTQ